VFVFPLLVFVSYIEKKALSG